MKISASICITVAAAALACAFPAAAQTVKIGLISSYSGPGSHYCVRIAGRTGYCLPVATCFNIISGISFFGEKLMSKITLGGEATTVGGQLPVVGGHAPDFKLVNGKIGESVLVSLNGHYIFNQL